MKSVLTSVRTRFAAASAAVTVLSACGVLIHSRILNATFPRAALCPEAVTLYRVPSDVGKRYLEVALLIPPPGDAEYHPSPEAVVRAQRKKAADIGANGMIVNQGRHRDYYLYDDALAIFIPEDSAHAFSACSETRAVR